MTWQHAYRQPVYHGTQQATAVVLRVVKSRTPLLQAGKLLYRLSKDSSNDPLFK